MSWLCLHDSATTPCSEPSESSRHLSTTFLWNTFSHLLPSMPVPPKLCLSLKFPYQNSPWTSLAYHMRHTPNHSVAIWQVMQLQSCLVCSMLQSLLIYPIGYEYSPQHLESLQTMFLPQSKRQFSHLYKTGSKITILNFTLLASSWKD
jgi:hypothetical protein